MIKFSSLVMKHLNWTWKILVMGHYFTCIYYFMLGNIYFLFYTIGQISSWSKPRSKLLAFIEKHEKAELEMKCKKKNFIHSYIFLLYHSFPWSLLGFSLPLFLGRNRFREKQEKRCGINHKQTNVLQNFGKPTCIELMLTNKPSYFQHSNVFGTGLSEFHLLTVTEFRIKFQKLKPLVINYRN